MTHPDDLAAFLARPYDPATDDCRHPPCSRRVCDPRRASTGGGRRSLPGKGCPTSAFCYTPLV